MLIQVLKEEKRSPLLPVMFALILAQSTNKGIVWLPPKSFFTWNIAHAHIDDSWSGNAIWNFLQNTSKVLKKHNVLASEAKQR